MTEAQILVQAVQQAATSASAAAKVSRAIVAKKQSGFAETATPNNVLRSLVTQSRRRMPQIRQIFHFFSSSGYVSLLKAVELVRSTRK